MALPTRSFPVVSPPDPVASALRAIRCAAAALEAGEAGGAGASLREASRLLVFLHTEAEERAGEDRLASEFRRIALRLKDADLLRDAGAARDAERAFAALAEGLRARRLAAGGRA